MTPVTSGLCAGRVAIVTGAGRGIGRAHALALAAAGARVVVNDIGVASDGSLANGGGVGPADEVVAEIRAAGGEAIGDRHDVTDGDAAAAMIRAAIDAFGGLDVLVNNAGIVRDRMFVSATLDEWDAVMRVHLRGHFAPAKAAVDYWRGLQKAGRAVDARIVNTTSGAGLLGSIGQAAYSTAKAGITALTLVQAAELGRYGVTANAIAPFAATRVTDSIKPANDAQADYKARALSIPASHVANLVAHLCSPAARDVTGQLFGVRGRELFLFGQPRPVAQTLTTGANVDLAALRPHFTDLATDLEHFSADPVL